MARNKDPGIDIIIDRIPTNLSKWVLMRALAEVIHSEDFAPVVERLTNFSVDLKESKTGSVGNSGTAFLTLPKQELGVKFLSCVSKEPIRLEGKMLRFRKKYGTPRIELVEFLRKTLYQNPDIEEEYENKVWSLRKKISVDAVQFGVFYQIEDSTKARPSHAFSIEWERKFINNGVASLVFDYESKLIRVVIGEEVRDDECYNIDLSFASFQEIFVGNDLKPYVCFNTFTPPVLEKQPFNRNVTGTSKIDNKKFKQRVGSLDAGHKLVSNYTPHLRVVFYNEHAIEEFTSMCQIAKLSSSMIIKCGSHNQIEALKNQFFTAKRLYNLRKALGKFDWPVAFQLESLLYNGLLDTGYLENLIPLVKELLKSKDALFIGDLLQRYNEGLQVRGTNETPMGCFESVLESFTYPARSSASEEIFRCCHVTFTPTRLILEGPYASDSNRVIRKYKGFEDHFIRVDFRDEDRLQYRWDFKVDGTYFLKDRVGSTLKEGFVLAGRKFEFLAYSSSALRNHAVWFMNPFDHFSLGHVNAASIRDSLGDFANTTLLKCPSKYAARLAQAFTATRSSVKIRKEEWEEVPDLCTCEKPVPKYVFTDGIGTISKVLGDKIWAALDTSRSESTKKPSAYQIRFLGYKGVVVVDELLDDVEKNPTRVQLRLRPSMRKFEVRADDKSEAEIEIVESFQDPKACYLNRALVMLLEDLGVRPDAFKDLQAAAVAEARTIDESVTHFCNILKAHSLGSSYRLREILERLEDKLKDNVDLKTDRKIGFDTPFLSFLRQVAMTNILRDVKYRARIRIPDSYLLVGVADEGPAYEAAGYENVYCLDPQTIYVCIENPDSDPIYLEGNVSISRSPVTHPGDVQRVRAIGKPPEGKLCFFKHLKNVVVMPSKGSRSMASCLSGGDVDGDLFSVIGCDSLLPRTREDPASYEPLEPLTVKWDSTVNDICDFVVEYINSDVLGLLSIKLLIIADQCIDGLRDEKCREIAELCSHAVDYPKLGAQPNLEGYVFPELLIRRKPDWQKAEVVSPWDTTDYYNSSRALGHMFRSFEISDLKQIPTSNSLPVDILSNPISQALMPDLRNHLKESTLVQSFPVELTSIFKRYCDELRYVCATHTLSNTPGVRLSEVEVVIGTILARCSQNHLRQDRVHRMRVHGATLVRDVQCAICDTETASKDDLIVGLERAWGAWHLSLTLQKEFGANSFGLIAIGIIFDCLDQLKKKSIS